MKEMEYGYEKIDELQSKEEKDHEKTWELRKRLLNDIESRRRRMDAKISGIIRDEKESIFLETPEMAQTPLDQYKKKKKISYH